MFDPVYQPWTGGGRHFSFLNQPVAAHKNFEMFCRALSPLLADYPAKQEALDRICNEFPLIMEEKMDTMWATKLGLENVDSDFLIQLMQLMVRTSVDYTLFFRELSDIPADVSGIQSSFYKSINDDLRTSWNQWLQRWHQQVSEQGDLEVTSKKMKQVNPKFTWREWLVVPAYQQAERGNYSLIEELQQVLGSPYDEQSSAIENKYYKLKPQEYFEAGGVSHYSCSS
jgi:uncharacterized protein YdiU (UPF0061 family)